MNKTTLVITSIANQAHPVLGLYAREAKKKNIPFIVIGDTKSPEIFSLDGCDFFSVARQRTLDFNLASLLPYKHYSRKNIGYLIAIRNGTNVIIETDDDNIPTDGFWASRELLQPAHSLSNTGWTNVYKYFSTANIWPRGFALEELLHALPALPKTQSLTCPVQQGLADENPDVDAIYRLTQPLPVSFDKGTSVALGENSICPFNSQNTTWFPQAFPLLYLPSYCSFRMTDIWRSFIAQRILWTCGWPVLFHQSTVKQERNDHSLMADFKDEIPGYTQNLDIVRTLLELDLLQGRENISKNLVTCYETLASKKIIDAAELALLDAWLKDLTLAGFDQ
jgi:hypothetical protein